MTGRAPDADDIRVVLDTIVDPCSRVAGVAAGLVEMGLIRRLSVRAAAGGEADGSVDVDLTIGVTEYGCLMAPAFADEARKRVGALPGVRSVDVALDGEFDWEPGDMSSDYRRRLAAHRLARARAFPVSTAPTGGAG